MASRSHTAIELSCGTIFVCWLRLLREFTLNWVLAALVRVGRIRFRRDACDVLAVQLRRRYSLVRAACHFSLPDERGTGA